MGGSPCWAKEGGLNRGAWTAQEDKILLEYVSIHGQGKWSKLPQRTGLKRSGKSCRLRWLNYLRPDIKRGNISPDEEELIIRLHKLLGNKWSLIAGRLPGRTDNEIKNYWNCKLSKKVEDSRTCASFAQHMKKTKMTSEPTPTPSLSSSPPNSSNNVILTKASKCSKVLFVDPLIPHSSMQLHSKNPNMEEPEAEAMGLHDVGNDLISSDKLMETNVNDDRVFRGEKSKDEELIDLLSDFDVADLLNSDFSCVLNFCYDNEEDILPFWDQQMVSFFGVLKDKDCDEADNNLFLENENGC